MIHKMNLDEAPFAATKKGKKIIEIRLFDEKRRQLSVNDILEFKNTTTGELLRVHITSIRKYDSIEELTTREDFSKTGGIYIDTRHWVRSIYSYYSKEDQKRFGLIAIEMALVTA